MNIFRATTFLLGLILTSSIWADETILNFNFTSNLLPVASKNGMGSMRGVLPKGCSENFSSWKCSDVLTSLCQEDGISFLRFEVKRESSQFCIGLPQHTIPGCFRVTLRLRCTDSGGMPYELRHQGVPYQTFWSSTSSSPEWKTEERVFKISQPEDKKPRAFLFYPANGTTDLCWVKIERVDEVAYLKRIRRPDPSVRQLIRHRHFPFGLPSGWSVRGSIKGTQAVRTSVSHDGSQALCLSDTQKMSLASEPFQVSVPKKFHVVTFDYKLDADKAGEFKVLCDNRHCISDHALQPSKDWKTVSFRFKPKQDALAFTVLLSVRGTFALDNFTVRPESQKEIPPESPSVTLAPGEGEIAQSTRIQFTAEPSTVKYAVSNIPQGTCLQAVVRDLYGKTHKLPAQVLDNACATGSIDYLAGRGVQPNLVGQFLVCAWLEKDGKRISNCEELQMTRLRRLSTYGKDAPDSPFGAHFLADEGMVKMMKAGGVNWMRLHDAATELSGWWALEAKKGSWTWHDEEIDLVRKNGIKIFAQLGTAPAWATHYGDLKCKHMGYFEKYLRPTNDVDWVNYVTAYTARYKGVIDDYFIWNEPWGEWWQGAADIKYYGRAHAARDFGVFSRLTADAVHRVNPQAKVSGFNTYGGYSGAKWTKGVMEGGGYEGCDTMDFHIYSQTKRCRWEEDSYSGIPFEPVFEAYRDCKKPIYMSEGQGGAAGSGGGNGLRMTGLYDAIIPWGGTRANDIMNFSDSTCRYIVSLLSERNVKRVFLYTTHGWQAMGIKPAYQTLVGADGFPHASLVAHAALAREIEGLNFVRKERFGKQGVGYVFEKESRKVTVWANLTQEEKKARLALAPMRDLYGNVISLHSSVTVLTPFTLVYQ